MRDNFCLKIQFIFTANPYNIDKERDTIIYAYDCKRSQRTFFTTSEDFREKSFKVINDNSNEIVHICVDGGLIEYGLEDYVGDGIVRGRCDCIIFDDNKLLLVEFKMDVGDSDGNLWKNFSKAMKQIKDFYLYLKGAFSESGDDLHTFFTNSNIIPVICMKNTPNIHPKRNVQRNNEKEKFRLSTNLKIQSFCEYEF